MHAAAAGRNSTACATPARAATAHCPASITRLACVSTPRRIEFVDQVQGAFAQDVEQSAGDPVIRRRDGLFAYLLAVVVDDAAQGVTHIVRGADLLDSTPRQIHLQRLLCHAEPMYAHVPVLTESDGAKLAKSRRSVALDTRAALAQLVSVFTLLGMPALPKDFAHLQDAWRWAHGAWSLNKVPKRMNLSVTS